MALTQLKTGAIADDAVTTDKLANAINTERTANTAKDLTALSASNLTSGTVPDARFPATLPAASAANLTAVPAANITGTLPAISATNLTDIPAANITGTLPAISGANLTNIPAANITGTLPAISGANLTSLTATNLTGTIADARFPATLPAISGANLTNLPASGKVLQIQQAVKTGIQSFTVSGGTHDISGLSVNITPSSSSNKIYIMADVGGHVHNSQGGAFLLVRTISGSATNINTADSDGSRRVSSFTGTLYTGDGGGALDITLTANCKFLDSPNTTSQVNYKVMMQKQSGNSLYCINRTESDNNTSDESRTISQITVMEVAA